MFLVFVKIIIRQPYQLETCESKVIQSGLEGQWLASNAAFKGIVNL